MVRAGIDIGGTKIRVGLIDAKFFALLGEKKLPVSKITAPAAEIRDALAELADECGVHMEDIVSVGAGVPGTVSEDGRRILKVPNISVLSENFADLLEESLGIPVTMIQDSRAAAWGEYVCGGGKGAKTLICMTLGTGVGTGIVIGGRIYHGALGCAGELGHLPAVPNGRPCGCGQRGCMEKYAAGRGLDITAAELLGKGMTAADLFRAAENGNEKAASAITEAVQLLGNAVVAAVNLLSPDVILFSGGLSEQRRLYLDPMIAYVKEHCYQSCSLPRMEAASLGENSPPIGAALAMI